MRFLNGLFESRAESTAKTAVSRAISGTVAATSGFAGMTGSVGQWDIEDAVLNGLEKVIWVYRCVDVIAENQSNLDMLVRKGDPDDGEPMKDDDLYRILNRHPNTYESAKQFRYRLSTQLLLSRRGAFVEVVKNNGGGIDSIHLLPPHRVEPVPDKEKFVSQYKIMGADYTEYYLEPERVLWVKAKPHPLDPYLQITPMVSAGIAADIDYYSRLFNRNFIMNDGRPGLLVAVAGNLAPQDAEELKRRFSGGPTMAGQTTVIEADDVQVRDLTTNPRDVQWLEGIRGSKEDIQLAFGVPESVMGNASGRTFDNADAERETFWMDTEVPHCGVIATAMDPLTGTDDDDIFVGYDFSKVDVLQRRVKERHNKMIEEIRNGLRSVDSYREETGQSPYGMPLSRALILPNGAVIPEKVQDNEAIQMTVILGGPPPVSPEESARAGAYQGITMGQRNFSNILAARMIGLQALRKAIEPPVEQKAIEAPKPEEGKVHPYNFLRTRLEGQIDGALDAWSSRQEAVIHDRLMHTKVRKSTRHWEGEGSGDKALDAGYVVQVRDWVKEASDVVARAVRPLVEREARKYARNMDAMGVVNEMRQQGRASSASDPLEAIVGGPVLVRQMTDNVVRSVTDVVDVATMNQTNRLAQRIRTMDDEGASIADIKKEVSRTVGARGSWRKNLATYVTTAAVEGTKATVYGAAGDKVSKVWNTTGDEKVRISHYHLDGDTKSATQPFFTGKGPIRYPGDPSAHISETANCFVYDTPITALGVQHGYRSQFVGDTVTVTTRSGQVVTGTPNHPVLTDHGWVPLHRLDMGDNLIRAVLGQNWIPWVDPDVEDMPTSIGQVFDALAQSGVGHRVDGVAVNFHGDIPNGDVDVVTTDRLLNLYAGYSSMSQHLRELEFQGTRPPVDRTTDSGRTSGQGFVRHSATSLGDVGGQGKTTTLVGTGLTHTDVHRFASVTRLDTGLDQPTTDRITTDAKTVSDALFALTGLVTLDDVVDVKRNTFTGHVYNLQTTSGMYLASGIIAHNCRCWLDWYSTKTVTDQTLTTAPVSVVAG